ncbi:hypothetical protein E4U57_002316 [Claviceps arundinis]|uniref:SUC2-invertase (Sucrose hydrolyzing enzyme) n=1 Tax=Claviceps arundinis TaxID=1623583 RepID=A0A9P7SQJ9_9HYPO|nr:hypothetical protein E4U57_002316 [Claviceps arundinis]KAG5971602.1 hypothetical protein E4U56_006705 [Claviceps arundinis]
MLLLSLDTGLHLAMSLLGALRLATAVHASPAPAGEVRVEKDSASGVAVVGDYTGPLRPQIHFSPPKGFMNDPNGMFRDDNGTWHYYYQYNPTGLEAGNQHWGHATSPDLYHWTNQPIALFPPKENVLVFTGSAVVDKNNTSGFFPNQTNGVVAIYTLAEYNDGVPGPQQQAIAYSHDGGYHFTPYEHNPVIPSNATQFRDPKVIWYEDHWVLAVAYPDDFAVGIYTSPNLIDWTHASNFTGKGLLGSQWECPNMVRMPYYNRRGEREEDMWLLLLGINPGAPNGGSGAVYFPGSFNGTHFRAVDHVARIADFGKDNYAGQFFYGQPDDEEPVFMTWASNWQYTQIVPTDKEGWRSEAGLPRRNYLTKDVADWKLVSIPYDLSPVMGETLLEKSLVNETATVDFSKVESNAVYWEANVTGIPESGVPATAMLNFTFANPASGDYIRGGHYFGGYMAFYLDRGGAQGFDDVFFTDKFSTNSLAREGKWSMSGVLDRSIVEVFLNGGIDSVTSTFFPKEPLTVMTIRSTDLPQSMQVSIRVSALKSSWAAMARSDRLVWGNQTVA